jgi:hypothetical protein
MAHPRHGSSNLLRPVHGPPRAGHLHPNAPCAEPLSRIGIQADLEELHDACNGVRCHRVGVREIEPMGASGIADEFGRSAEPPGKRHKFFPLANGTLRSASP